MRKTELRMLTAIRDHRDFRGKNTEVTWGYDAEEDLAHVYLFGNLIALARQDGTIKHASFHNHDTATTRSRLSALGVDTWKLRYEEGHVTQEEYMAHLRRVENERTRRKLLSA